MDPMKRWDYIGWISVDPHNPDEIPQPVMGVVWATDEYDASRKAEEELYPYIGQNGPAAGAALINWYVRPRGRVEL